VALDGVEEDDAAFCMDEVIPQIELHDHVGVHELLGQSACPVVLDLVV